LTLIPPKAYGFGLEPSPTRLWHKQSGVTSGGAVMTLRISLLLMLVSVLGCASQIERVQTTQPTTEQTQEEQAKKPALPTITYRPGF
jgi:hypothetical protein